MNHNNNMDEDVLSILAILQQSPEPETAVPPPPKPPKNTETARKKAPSVLPEKKAVKAVKTQAQTAFLSDVNEPEDKSVYNSKVLIREEIYEVFMSLKRLKKVKSVSTLIDAALEEYIKRNKDAIKAALYDGSTFEKI